MASLSPLEDIDQWLHTTFLLNCDAIQIYSIGMKIQESARALAIGKVHAPGSGQGVHNVTCTLMLVSISPHIATCRDTYNAKLLET